MGPQAAIPSTITFTESSALQQAIEPYPIARRFRIDRQYRVLCAGPRGGQNLSKWLDKWLKFYGEAKLIKHPDIETGVIIDDFINSFKQTDPSLTAISLCSLEFRRFRKEQTPFLALLHTFRSYWAIQGQTLAPSSTSEKSKRRTGNTPPKECVCGKMHWYSDCFYINESRRPKGWNPNPNVVKKIDEALKDTKVKANVERAKERNSRG